jgi:ABC-type amino acid transport substrate-binding protein
VPTAPPTLFKVRVAYTPTVPNAGLFLGISHGYFAQEGLELELVSFDSGEQALPALATGQVEAVLLESAMVRWQAKQQPAMFRLAGLPMLPRPYGAAVRDTDATLLTGLNGALAQLRATGALRKLLTGYGLWDSVQEAPKAAPRALPPKR